MTRHIGEGDRVIVTAGVREAAHMRGGPRPELEGLHGLVQENDGWGFCRVLLDNGQTVHLWNSKDLEREP